MAAVAEWWQTKALAELDPQQWEALCDGCAKCCLHKLEDEDDGEVFYTRVRCRYLDEKSCRCSDYPNRSVLVPNCIRLEPGNVRELDWLPSTCAYRLRARGEPLADWHPLVSGRADSVHRAGVSIRGRSISDEYVHPDGFEEHIIHWVE
jgi:uncharacterized cysteine cluster protein YcgN (CxxCxxCC family)